MPLFSEGTPIPLTEAEFHDFNLSDHPIRLWVAPPGYLLDIRDQYSTNRSDGRFNAVLELGSLLADRKMSDSSIPADKRWGMDTMPEGIEVAEFNDDSGEVGKAADDIEHIVNASGFDAFHDPLLVSAYMGADQIIARTQLPPGKREDWVPVAVVRAGVPALEAAGFPFTGHVLVSEKRLNRLDDPTILAVGINYDEKSLGRLKGKKAYIRERAQATSASLIALELMWAAQDVLPGESIWATAIGTQQGYELGLEFRDMMQQEFGKQITMKAGRLRYILSGPPHPYYIQSDNGNYSAGDGGDWGDLLLPAHLRKLFPGTILEGHIRALAELHPRLGDEVDAGQAVDFNLVMRLRDVAVHELGLGPFTVGRALTGLTP